MSPFDLHVLSTPPAFILSQDQTLRQKTPFGVSLRIWCITIENDRASSSYHSSVVKVLIPRARFYSLYRLSSRLVDKNADGPFFTGRHRPVSTICLGSILKPSACFALLRICWLQRNLQRTWDRYCNCKFYPCQGSLSSHFSYLVLGFQGSALSGKTSAVSCATRGDYTICHCRVKG